MTNVHKQLQKGKAWTEQTAGKTQEAETEPDETLKGILPKAAVEHPHVKRAAVKMFAFASLYLCLSKNEKTATCLFSNLEISDWYVKPRVFTTHQSIVTVQAKGLGWFAYESKKEKKGILTWALERTNEYKALFNLFGIDPQSKEIVDHWKSVRKWS